MPLGMPGLPANFVPDPDGRVDRTAEGWHDSSTDEDDSIFQPLREIERRHIAGSVANGASSSLPTTSVERHPLPVSSSILLSEMLRDLGNPRSDYPSGRVDDL